MTFQDVLAANGFEFEREKEWPRFGVGSFPTLPRSDEFYRQVDGEARATVSFYDGGSISMCCCLQTGPAVFSFVGQWDSPELAAVELPQKLLTSVEARR